GPFGARPIRTYVIPENVVTVAARSDCSCTGIESASGKGCPVMIAACIASLRHRPAVKTAVAWFGVLALGGLFAFVWARAPGPGGYGVHCFLPTARAARAGHNPYLAETSIPYNYPLLACTAAVPLTFLPEPVVHVGWFLATLAAWTAVAFLLVNRLRPVTGIGWDGGLLLPFVLAVVLIYGAVPNHLFN